MYTMSVEYAVSTILEVFFMVLPTLEVTLGPEGILLGVAKLLVFRAFKELRKDNDLLVTFGSFHFCWFYALPHPCALPYLGVHTKREMLSLPHFEA